MPEAELDDARLAELQETLGTDLAAIVETLIREFSRAFAAMAQAARAGDTRELALAAHAARSSALMIGARPMLDQLRELESAARREDGAAAGAAHERLAEAWPALRRRLRALAAGA